MKLTVFLMLISFIGVFASETYSQTTKLSLKAEKISLEEFLIEIENQSEFRFFYTGEIDVEKKVSGEFKKQKITEILDEIKEEAGIKYEVMGRQIILSPKDAASTIKSVQQQKSVSGTVTDDAGLPLPGVTVVIKGTTLGTVTNADGDYTLTGVPEGATLQFSFVGMLTQEIEVGNQSNIDVQMVLDAIGIEEVVAIGYGTQKRSTLTGAVGTVGSDIVRSKPVTNIANALQGALPGLTVTRGSGQPGKENYNLTIRDFTSVNGGNSPLILVDGVEGSLGLINPDDIETISVLKDAAASIYGSRAAGGVILVTTKSGKKGAPTIEYRGGLTIKTPQDTYDQPTILQYAEMHREAEMNEGRPYPWWMPNEVYDRLLDGSGVDGVDIWAQDLNAPNPRYYFYNESDIKDNLFANSINQNHSVSVSGGSDKTTYYLSGAYNRDEGFFKIKNNISEKFNLKLNYNYQIADWLNLDARVGIERLEIDEPKETATVLRDYPRLNPMPPTYTPTGNYYQWQGFVNPVQLIDQAGRRKENRNELRINLKSTIDITKELSFVSQVGITRTNLFNNTETPTWLSYHWDDKLNKTNNSPNRFDVYASDRTYQSYTNYLNYKRDIKENHNISLTLGTAYENDDWYGFSAYRRGLVSNELFALNLGDAEEQYNSDGGAEWTILSYFGRFNYDFKGKYLFEVNWRRDGSSKFHPDKRWGNFGGVSMGWRLSEEEFIKKLNYFDNLKLRASVGQAGNQSVASIYNYVQTINIGGFYPFGSTAQPSGASLGALPATQATWETLETRNIGLDFSVLNNRLSGSFDVYKKVNKDMLISEAFPEMLGANAPKVNSGELEVKGWELSLAWSDKIGEVKYFVNGTLYDSKNKITKKGGDDAYWSGINNARLGYPINSYFGYDFDGIIKTQEQLAEYNKLENINQNLDLGDVMFRDVDGNGRLDPFGAEGEEGDLVYLGNMSPRFNYSGNIGAEWNNFDFQVTFQGVGKRVLFNGSAEALPYSGGRARWYKPNAMYWNSGFAQELKDADGRVIVEARDSDMPRLTLGTTNSWNWQHSKLRAWNGAYMRVKSIILGYTLPQKITSKVKLQHVRVYFNGADLFTFHNVPGGYDPEQFNVSNIYPYSKNYIFGIQVKL